jgi:hypothetical protein
MLTPNLSNSALESMAPLPMKRLCANEIWPAMPPTIFHDDASATYTKDNVRMCR